MKPHSDKNYIMVCHDNEIRAEIVHMAGGDVLARWRCPKCGDQRSYKFTTIDKLNINSWKAKNE